jgi:hypothetical protein
MVLRFGFGTVLIVVASLVTAAEPPARIAWYGQLAEGIAEAQRSSRPILLVSGAPQCHGVPGVW